MRAPAVAVVEQMISDTWIGETGRGYFIQGIWMDADLNKFFTKLVIPQGKRIYPYYPFTSKYRTICHNPIGISSAQRREAIPRLHRFIDFLKTPRPGYPGRPSEKRSSPRNFPSSGN